jgi:hypothetical protein
MAEDLLINVGGTWKSITDAEINVGGTWKTPTEVKINVGGTWKLVWPLAGGFLVLNNLSDDDVVTGVLVVAGMSFALDGGLNGISEGAVSGEWWSDEPETNIGNGYEVRCESMNGGSTWSSQPDSVGNWVTISVTRTWNCRVTAMATGIKSAQGNFEIGVDGVESAVETAIFSAYADNT